MPLLKVENLVKHFPIRAGLLRREVGAIHAVDGISFNIYKGETFGLVGESGCGKSTAGRTILRLYEPTSGKISFDGIALEKLSGAELRNIRTRMQMIFQDPYASLNPRMSIREIISEAAVDHKKISWKESEDFAVRLLEMVNLNPMYVRRYPHEFSGGQRQRIGIARAIAINPDFIICDEPISALDVSVQAQIINLLETLQDQLGITYLFIAHDLAMVRHTSDRVGVMYLGKIVELAECDELFNHPFHPYTKALLSAVPNRNAGARKQRILMSGDVPSPAHPPSGCRFHTRCPYVMKQCSVEEPQWKAITSEHFVACHLKSD